MSANLSKESDQNPENPVRFERTKRYAKNTLSTVTCGAFAGALVVAAIWANEHIIGHGDSDINEADYIAKARANVVASARQTTAKDLFTISFLADTVVEVDGEHVDGTGLRGMLDLPNFKTVTFHNSCLNESVYDILGGDPTYNEYGDMISSGSLPTASLVPSENPDTLIVNSGVADTPRLQFTGVSAGALKPFDEYTADFLQMSGCVETYSIEGQ